PSAVFCFLCSTPHLFSCFFFIAPSPTVIYTLSLHDALPISGADRSHRLLLAIAARARRGGHQIRCGAVLHAAAPDPGNGRLCSSDRKSTRLNSSHVSISYAVFCLKKKKINRRH